MMNPVLSLRIWLGLQKPQRSSYKRHFLDPRQRRKPPLSRPYAAAVIVSSVIFAACMVPSLLLLLCALPFSILFAGTLCGGYSTLHISGRIAHEREQGRYDLMSITAWGRSGLNWRISHDVYRGIKTVQELSRTITWIVVFFLFLCITWLVIAAITNTDVVGVMTLITVSVLFYVDFAQSIVMGCVLGMLIPTYAPEQLAARAVGVGVFLLVQFVLYAVLMGVLVTFTTTLTSLSINDDHLRILGLIAVSGLLRESVIAALWWWLARRLETDVSALNRAIRTLTTP